MQFNIMITLLFILVSCGDRSIPLLDGNTTQLIGGEEYEEFIVHKLEQTINQSHTPTQSSDIYLKHITYGFSLDVRVGLFGWKIGSSSSIEFHMLPKTNEEYSYE
jgi:hypothetical protein